MLRKGDYKKELVDYFKKNLKKGYTKESLKFALIDQGNSRVEVERALFAAEKELASEAPILKTKPEIKYEIIKIDSDGENSKKSFWKKLFGK